MHGQVTMEYFYGGLLQAGRSLLDATAEGCLVDKPPQKQEPYSQIWYEVPSNINKKEKSMKNGERR